MESLRTPVLASPLMEAGAGERGSSSLLLSDLALSERSRS